MKSKLFKLHAQTDTDDSTLNKFLESVEVKQIFAQVVNEDGHFWSILVFYEDVERQESPNDAIVSQAQNSAATDKVKNFEKPESESVSLTSAQEIVFNELKKWRNEKASRDGIPPYLIAHNFSLVQIAASSVESKEDLIKIKGFSEKRAEKYGDEILEILAVSSGAGRKEKTGSQFVSS